MCRDVPEPRSERRTITLPRISVNPTYERAREQHDRYVGALEGCGLEVTVLDADERYPDSVFIEDTAVVTDRCAIVANPGAEERRGEVREVEKALAGLYGIVERIAGPGTLDGGDVLQVGDHFYVGLTRRTNREGAEQLSEILRGTVSGSPSWGCGGSCTSRPGLPISGATTSSWPGSWSKRTSSAASTGSSCRRKRSTAPTAPGQRPRPRGGGLRDHERRSPKEATRSSSWRCPSSARWTAGSAASPCAFPEVRGLIYLVGSGPGDPGLFTLKGAPVPRRRPTPSSTTGSPPKLAGPREARGGALLRRQEARRRPGDEAGGDQRPPREARARGQERRAPEGRRPLRLRARRRGGARPDRGRPALRGRPRRDERDSRPRLRRDARYAPGCLDQRRASSPATRTRPRAARTWTGPGSPTARTRSSCTWASGG